MSRLWATGDLSGLYGPRVPARIRDNIGISEEGCWEWMGAKSEGYGQASWRGQAIRTHTLMWELLVGPREKGKHLHHKCENPTCCNPAHLEHLTPREHMKRHYGTTCPDGHDMTVPANVRIRKDGGRYCRTCDRERNAFNRQLRSVPCTACGQPRMSDKDAGAKRNFTGLCLRCYRVSRRREATSGVPA